MLESASGVAGIDDLIHALQGVGYHAPRQLATSVYLAMKLQRPLLLEGEPGVGKTELAKALAKVLGRPMLRLQCYDGMEQREALYEWNHTAQLLHMRAAQDTVTTEEIEREVYQPRYLIRRPLLQALQAPAPGAVLLIDEVDRADEPFEAFLLEYLGEYQVSIPELGTIKAEVAPLTILTSNRTRDLNDAVKRRCLYQWMDYPERERELAIAGTCAAAYASGQEINLEFRITGAHGGRRWVRCRGLPAREGGRFAEPETWSVQDITFYKSRFEEKSRLSQELSQQVRERTKKLEASNKSLGEFSYALSHDLRTPLRHVASFAELLRDDLRMGRLDSSVAYAEKILTGARQMQGLIEAMLSFAHLGKASLKIETVDLSKQIQEVASSLEADSATQHTQWGIATDLPTVQADTILIREVWVNLLSNALKYARHRTVAKIEVGWYADQKGWTVFVRDNGIGFDPKHAEKLFGMFERLHRDTRFEGLGVGLALARQVVDSHGGRIWADSTLGKGATFSVFLPFAILPHNPTRT